MGKVLYIQEKNSFIEEKYKGSPRAIFKVDESVIGFSPSPALFF